MKAKSMLFRFVQLLLLAASFTLLIQTINAEENGTDVNDTITATASLLRGSYIIGQPVPIEIVFTNHGQEPAYIKVDEFGFLRTNVIVEDANGSRIYPLGVPSPPAPPRHWWMTVDGKKIYTEPVVKMEPGQTTKLSIQDSLELYHDQLQPGTYYLTPREQEVIHEVDTIIIREDQEHKLWIEPSAVISRARYETNKVKITLFQGKIIYVDDNAVGANDGTSWENAYIYPQDALADANSADKPVEIRVAQGIYKPDQGANQTPGDRKATFQLLNETIVKGGYAGFGQADPNARDFELYNTILSGDLADNDVPVGDPSFLSENPRFLFDDTSRTDNCIRVITATNANSNTVLEGIVITGAYFYYPEDNGYSSAGLYVSSHANITVSKCIFTSNAATGIFCLGSDPIVMDCNFNDNIGAPKGGGIYIYSGNPRVIRCAFEDNWAGDGGGLYGNGGRLWLENCIFIHNVASGLRYADVGFGGGICCDYSYESGSRIINCIFIDNVASSGGAAHFGLIGMAPPISRKDERILLTGCTFIRNRASFGGALHQRLSTLDIHNSVFNKNLALRIGGAISTSLSITNLEHCIFSGNSSFDSGASIYATGSETSSVRGDPLLLEFILTLKNCTFRSNSAPLGRTLHCMSHDSEDVDTTIISNCIIDNGGNEIHNPDGSQITIDYTNLLGGASLIDDPCNAVVWGTGNINEDPLFIDPGYWDPNGTSDNPNDDFWVDGDYHLKSQVGRWDTTSESWVQDDVTSPCIDAGDPNSPVGDEPEPNGGRINMGAYGGTTEAGKSYVDESL